ncbi:MAG TPA: hypothetical protein DCQ78_06715 [Ruminococcus sp.]|nr:hypothetical protein [Ruminococcus sp.]
MKGIKPRQIIFAVLSIVCMIIIFRFSADNAEESTEKSDFFVNILESLPIALRNNLSFIIRKTAHFSIYALLGFLISGIFFKKEIFYTLSACFLYACTDEIHQYFVAGRSCRFQDVMIDTAGSFFGILIFILIVKLLNRKGA